VELEKKGPGNPRPLLEAEALLTYTSLTRPFVTRGVADHDDTATKETETDMPTLDNVNHLKYIFHAAHNALHAADDDDTKSAATRATLDALRALDAAIIEYNTVHEIRVA